MFCVYPIRSLIYGKLMIARGRSMTVTSTNLNTSSNDYRHPLLFQLIGHLGGIV